MNWNYNNKAHVEFNSVPKYPFDPRGKLSFVAAHTNELFQDLDEPPVAACVAVD